MIYKIAVCDDERIFVDDVVEKIREQSEQCDISEYTSGEELLNTSLEFNIEAYGDGTYIYDKAGNVYDTDRPLKYWKEQIGSEHFFQIHKSFIVSYLYVSDVSKTGQVSIKGFKQTLDISRRNVVPFRNGFFDYIRKYARIV